MGNYFTEGLILRHLNFREADRLVSIYSQERGLINVIAKGSRKISSKLAGSLEPITLAEFMIVRGKNYDTVASSEIIEVYRKIKSDLRRIRVALFFSEIVMNTAKEMQKDINIYEFLIKSFDRLQLSPLGNQQILNWQVWYFLWQYLKHSGYKPELYFCQECKTKITPEKIFFNYKKGGLVCKECGSGANNVPITQNMVKIIRLILVGEYRQCQKITITSSLRDEITLHTKNYFSYVTERPVEIPFFK